MGATKTSIVALIISVLALILAAWPSISPDKGPALSPDLFRHKGSGEINLQNQVLELQCYVRGLAYASRGGSNFSTSRVLLGTDDCANLIRSTMDLPGKGK